VSHQFPVLLVVAVTVKGADVVDVVVDTMAVVAVVVVGLLVVVVVVVVAVVVVDEPQEARTIEATMRKLTNIQIVPFFTCSSFFILRIIH
jgi:hypothetical protein